jgi:PPE-repeat protein
MNAAELNTELGKLMARAWKEGLAAGKMAPCEPVGLLQLHAAEFAANIREAQRAAAAAVKPIMLPNFRLPPHRRE